MESSIAERIKRKQQETAAKEAARQNQKILRKGIKRVRQYIDPSLQESWYAWQDLQEFDRVWVEDEEGNVHPGIVMDRVLPFVQSHRYHDEGIRYQVQYDLTNLFNKITLQLVHPSRFVKVVRAATGRIEYRDMAHWDDMTFK